MHLVEWMLVKVSERPGTLGKRQGSPCAMAVSMTDSRSLSIPNVIRVGVAVGVTVGVRVGVAVGVWVNVGTGVLVRVAVGVLVGVRVAVAVGVCVGVNVAAAVVAVAVSVKVGVGVYVGLAVMVACGTKSAATAVSLLRPQFGAGTGVAFQVPPLPMRRTEPPSSAPAATVMESS